PSRAADPAPLCTSPSRCSSARRTSASPTCPTAAPRPRSTRSWAIVAGTWTQPDKPRHETLALCPWHRHIYLTSRTIPDPEDHGQTPDFVPQKPPGVTPQCPASPPSQSRTPAPASSATPSLTAAAVGSI